MKSPVWKTNPRAYRARGREHICDIIFVLMHRYCAARNLPEADLPGAGTRFGPLRCPATPRREGEICPGAAPLGKSWCDAFQLTVNKRYSHGLQVNFNYNYSKNLSLTTSPDPFNRGRGKILDAFDLPQQARLTVLYQIPETRKLGTPILSNKWVSEVVSGRGLGGYLNYQSAGLVGRPTSSSTTPISQFLGYGPGGEQWNGTNPWSVDWTDYSGDHHTDPIDVNCHCFDPTKNLVLNPAVMDQHTRRAVWPAATGPPQ